MNSLRIEQPTPDNRTRKIPNSTWAEIRTAHASGIGLRELARNVGIPAGTVLARAKREGWTRSVRDAKTLSASFAAPVVSVATAAAATMAERGQRHVERVAGIVERTLPAVESMKPGAILDRIEDVDRLDKLARRTYGLEDGGQRGGISLTFNCLDPSMIRERVIEASVNAAN